MGGYKAKWIKCYVSKKYWLIPIPVLPPSLVKVTNIQILDATTQFSQLLGSLKYISIHTVGGEY